MPTHYRARGGSCSAGRSPRSPAAFPPRRRKTSTPLYPTVETRFTLRLKRDAPSNRSVAVGPHQQYQVRISDISLEVKRSLRRSAGRNRIVVATRPIAVQHQRARKGLIQEGGGMLGRRA